MAVNDRVNFKDLPVEDIRLIDKMHKIGKENLPSNLIDFVNLAKPTDNLVKIFKVLKEDYKLVENKDFFLIQLLQEGLITTPVLFLK